MKTKTEFDYASYQKGERYGLQLGILMGVVLGLTITLAVVYFLTLNVY